MQGFPNLLDRHHRIAEMAIIDVKMLRVQTEINSHKRSEDLASPQSITNDVRTTVISCCGSHFYLKEC